MVEFKKKFGSEPDEEYKLTVLVCTAEGTKRDQVIGLHNASSCIFD
jgi:hypothetical protein